MANIYVSSGTSFSATISITYPSGSTCTVSNYKKTWTAPNTSGSWTFKAHEVGIYTVKATKGSQTKSQTVAITTQGQVVDVALTFARLIFKDGVFTEVTGASRLSYGTVSIQDGCIYLDNSSTNQYSGLTLKEAVTLKSSETVRVHIASGNTWAGGQYKPRVVICDAKPTGINTETGNPSGTNIIASKTIETFGSSENPPIPEQTVEIPIGSAAGSRYIAALISGGTYVSANLKIAEISIWP